MPISTAPPTVDALITRNAACIPTHTTPQIFTPGIAPRPGTKRIIVLTCMDHRVYPEEFLGLNGDVVVIRNAGGRARHAIFDIAVLDTLVEVSDVLVVHHKNCGLTLTTDDNIRKKLSARSVKKVIEWGEAFREGVCFTE